MAKRKEMLFYYDTQCSRLSLKTDIKSWKKIILTLEMSVDVYTDES